VVEGKGKWTEGVVGSCGKGNTIVGVLVGACVEEDIANHLQELKNMWIAPIDWEETFRLFVMERADTLPA
jgi:hypothetical protein